MDDAHGLPISLLVNGQRRQLRVDPRTSLLQVDFVDKPDLLLNSAVVKGLGEVANVGPAAAVANAVYHATGRRVRHLPIRIEDLLV